MMTVETNPTKVITGVARLSYVHVFEPKSINGSEPKYSVAVLIPKTDKATIEKLKLAMNAALEHGKTSKFGGKVPPNLKMPLRDGDVDRPDDDVYKGHYFINCNSDKRPGIAKPVGKHPDGRTKFQEITDTTELYSGCYGRVSINFYAFNINGNRGIAAGLGNIVKVQDGEPLAGRASVEREFADLDFDDFDYNADDDYMN